MIDSFDLNTFFEKVSNLKDEFGIETSSTRSNEINSKRIAILIANCYLKCNGDLHWAGILERKIYEAIKALNFTCAPIPCELNWEEKRAKAAKAKSFDPLKLALNKLDRVDGFYPMIIFLNNKIIEMLSTKEMEAKNADIRKCKNSRLDQCRRISQSVQVQQIDRIILDKRKRTSLHQTGK